MNEKLIQTFLCFPAPIEVKSKKNMLYSTLENSNAKIHWVKNHNLHLTVKFMGHTTESSVSKIINTVSNITLESKPFRLIINGTGCFPKMERPRTLFMGIEGSLNTLYDLVSRIENELEKLGFPKESAPLVILIVTAPE